MLAVVTLHPGVQGRNYRLSTERDYQAIWKAQKRLKAILDEWESGGKKGLCPVPDETINPIRPSPNARGLSGVTRYGMLNFSDLFSTRQKVALLTFADLIQESNSNVSRACVHLLAIAIGRLADASVVKHWQWCGTQVRRIR